MKLKCFGSLFVTAKHYYFMDFVMFKIWMVEECDWIKAESKMILLKLLVLDSIKDHSYKDSYRWPFMALPLILDLFFKMNLFGQLEDLIDHVEIGLDWLCPLSSALLVSYIK